MHNAAKPRSDQKLHLRFPSDNFSVRQALQQVLSLNLSSDEKSTVQIVLAEVLNNIVEHAYQENPEGRIHLTVDCAETGLHVWVQDDGLSMPEGLLTQQVNHDLTCKTDDLPEGGFGWLLVRELTKDLHSERRDGRNILSFFIPSPNVKET